MPSIKFIEADGREFDVEVEEGVSVMQAAMDNMIDGIVAECGGACSCATCHCYVDDAWIAKAGQPDEMENDMLDAVMDREDGSRLSCQINMSDDLDGIIIRLPESQF